MGSGQCSVKLYNRSFRGLIRAGRATPSFIMSRRLTLDQARNAYQRFDAREHGWTKSSCAQARSADISCLAMRVSGRRERCRQRARARS